MSNINFGQLCVSNPKKSNKYSRLYLADPEKKFLEKFGRLGILVNLDLGRNGENKIVSQSQEWTQSLIDFIKNNFYSAIRPTGDAEKTLEDLLQKINEWFQQEKIKRSDLLEKYIINFDIAIIIVRDKNIYFSQVGDIKTYLIPVSSADKHDNYAIQELTGDQDESQAKSIKFSNITSGVLEDDSVLIFATKNLFDYFPLKKISQMFRDLSVKQAIAEINQLLLDEIERANLLALIISNRDESLLSAPDKTLIKEKDGQNKETKTGSEEKLKISKEINKKSQSLPQKPLKAQSETKRVKIPELLKPSVEKTISPIKLNPVIEPKSKRQKIFLIVLVVFALLFIQSSIILGGQELKNRQNKKYTQLIENLRNKESELSIELIYPDSGKSEKLFAEINQLLNELPQKTQEQKENYQLFYNRHVQRMNKFYHLTVLDNLEPLIDLKQIDENIKTGGLANIGDNFYIFNPENNYIYFYNIQTKEAKIVNNTSANVGRLKQLSFLDDDNLIGYDQNQGLTTFNTIDNKLIPLKIERAHETVEIKDLCVYGGRIYLLEPTSNQIYKYSKTIDGFGKEEAWIQDGTNIADALSLTIDSSVYVLKKDGQIFKLYKNKKEEFVLDNIQPILSVQDLNAANAQEKVKIFTDSDRTYLYLLDGPSKRLIILSKQGKLIKQFTSPLFENLQGFIVSGNEAKAWVLAGTKIFEIQIK